MVHPYLRRRNVEEAVEYPSAALEDVLAKTLGVPLFQEQAMRIAVVAAGFTPGEADALRRAMAAWRRPGLLDAFKDKLVEGMVANGYTRAFAERCFSQILGFGESGFPESHAASFALLVYVSAWLKCHYPAAFACALLNSQPMGFYAPAQIVRDAREHGVAVLPADVNASDWDCTLEANNNKGDDGIALRLGLRQIKGVREADAEALMANRDAGYGDVHELARRAGLGEPALAKLARADAFRSMGLDRRQAAWAVKGIGPAPLPLFAATDGRAASGGGAREPAIRLPGMGLGEQVAEGYATLRLSLRQHPVAFVRDDLAADGFVAAKELATIAHGRRVAVAGLVTIRQRPATARGIIFVTLEDETGVANLVVRADVFERYRKPMLSAVLLAAHGRLEREGIVIHLVVDRLADLTPRLRALTDPAPPPIPILAEPVLQAPSRNFR